MSHSGGAVKFKDGAIMFCEYNGTVDLVRPPLFNTNEEMHNNWRKEYDMPECEHQLEEVEVYVTYGRGFYWEAKACRKCNRIIERLEPDHYAENRWSYDNSNEEEWFSIDGV